MATTRAKQNDTQNGTREESSEDRTYGDAYQVWGNFYQQMAEEGMDLFQKSMQTAQSMMPNAASQDIYRYWSQSFQEFAEQSRQEGFPTDPQSYRKMYDLWLETWSKSFETYMKTPEFVSSSGKNLEAMSDFKAKMGEMMEAYWHTLHLPSTQDMREIYHKLYITERKFDEQDRKLDEVNRKLSEILDLLKAGKNAAASPRSGKSKE